MSADMMMISEQDDSGWDGKNTDFALFVDETSIGCPSTAMGEYIQMRFNYSPDIHETLAGVKKTWEDFSVEVQPYDIVAFKAIVDSGIPRHEKFDDGEFLNFLQRHVGKKINTENW